MNKENILFIPGWLDEGKFYGYPNSLDVWTKKDLSLDYQFKESIVVAHSAGSLVALFNWKNNPNTKVILFGPMFPRRHLLSWLYRWLIFIFREGAPRPVRGFGFLKHLVLSTQVLLKVLKFDALEVIRKMPKDKIVILRGARDNYFCDKRITKILQAEGFNIIEISDVGHNWTKEVDNFLINYSYEQ